MLLPGEEAGYGVHEDVRGSLLSATDTFLSGTRCLKSPQPSQLAPVEPFPDTSECSLPLSCGACPGHAPRRSASALRAAPRDCRGVLGGRAAGVVWRQKGFLFSYPSRESA